MRLIRLRSALALAVLLVLPTAAAAQVATPASHFAWTEAGQTPAAALTYVYRLYVDGSPTALQLLANVACVVGVVPANADCTADIPALTVGAHTATLTQAVALGGESAKSNLLSFTFVVVVTPSGFTIKDAAAEPDGLAPDTP